MARMRNVGWAGSAMVSILGSALVASCNPQGNSCNLVACVNRASFRAELAADASRLLYSTLEVCRNNQCIISKFGPSDSAKNSYSMVSEMTQSASLSGKGPWVAAFIENTGTGYQFVCDYVVGNVSQLNNGDHYQIRLTDASGEPLLDADRTATYEAQYPNGPHCDAEPCMYYSSEL